MIYLLDVNVLLAYAYRYHTLHERTARWVTHVQLTSPISRPFMTCAIVELGFIRIAAGREKLAPDLRCARTDLQRIKSELQPRMLGDALDGNQLPEWVAKPTQTTDGHLLELARKHQVEFATLDAGIIGAALIPEDIDPPHWIREPAPPYYGTPA